MDMVLGVLNNELVHTDGEQAARSLERSQLDMAFERWDGEEEILG